MYFFRFQIVLSILIFGSFIQCEKQPEPCPDLQFDGKTTTFEGKIYTGTCATLYDSGEINSIQSYKEGKDHGEWRFYYQDGTLETEGKFHMGKRVGVWKYYHSNGKLHKKNSYDQEGNRKGKWYTYDAKGDLMSVTGY